jgi:hypothetical protein
VAFRDLLRAGAWIAGVLALAAGCIDPVRSGYPSSLVPCSSCDLPYVCNSDGGCEIQACFPDAGCPTDAGLSCQKIGADLMLPDVGQCLLPDGG